MKVKGYEIVPGADLREADLREADLRGANLREADLRGANLREADLRYANLRGADLENAQLPVLSILPDEGDVIGWKKCSGDIIVKLRIPAEAKRSNATGRKCRAEYAQVLEIFGAEEAYSMYNRHFTYETGRIVRPDTPFDEDWTVECGSGIHFFITRQEAVDYIF